MENEMQKAPEMVNATGNGTAPAPYAAGTGSAQLLPDRAALTRMSYRERLALKRTDPVGYQALRGK